MSQWQQTNLLSEQGEDVSTVESAALGAALGAIIGLTYSHTDIVAPLLGTGIGALIGAAAAFASRTYSAPYAVLVGAIAIAALVVVGCPTLVSSHGSYWA